MKLLIKTSLIILAFVFISCNAKEENSVETALQEVVNKFPQLPQNENGKLLELYRLTRTVIIGERNIELQLRSMPDSINDYQQIIVFKNPQNEYYAIPFFSNTYRDYWNFEFDNLDIPFKANTTFEREFNKAMEILNLHDTIGTYGNVQMIVFEMFESLLQCPLVELNDSLDIQQVSWSTNDNYNLHLDDEDSDSCTIRKQKNFEDIQKVIAPSEYMFNYNTAWDKYNNRIYQVCNNHDMRKRTKYVLKLKTYRQDCICHPLKM